MSVSTLEPVDVDPAALANWLHEAAVDHETNAVTWLTLVVAIQRDFGELIRQLPAGALAGVPARAAGESVEALLDRLRAEISAVATP